MGQRQSSHALGCHEGAWRSCRRGRWCGRCASAYGGGLRRIRIRRGSGCREGRLERDRRDRSNRCMRCVIWVGSFRGTFYFNRLPFPAAGFALACATDSVVTLMEFGPAGEDDLGLAFAFGASHHHHSILLLSTSTNLSRERVLIT